MANTITSTEPQKLVIVTCWCGIRHAVPESLRKNQLREHNDGLKPTGIFCPLGHTWIPAGNSKHELLQHELQRERASHDQQRANLRDRLERAKRQTAAQKAAKTRLKNRVAAGVCPCCNRHFENLARHMTGQHPGFAKSDD